LFADTYSVLVKWRKYFSKLSYVYGVSDVRHTEIHTAEPIAPDPSAFEAELAN
jgi:hypothetical protein